MGIFAISDLHLSFAVNKPMDRFGQEWEGHAERVARSWRESVGSDDTVLVCGDTSWAMRLDEARPDLDFVGALPGRKILLRGNHDYWWSAIGKVRKALPERVVALQNDAIDLGDVVVCGSRCWSAPGALDFGEADQKIYERELGRLRLSLEAGSKLAAGRPLIAAIHYPPFAADKRPTGFAELLDEFGVRLCVYGHLHGRRAHRTAVTGAIRGVHYRLIACDYLDFRPTQVWPIEAGG